MNEINFPSLQGNGASSQSTLPDTGHIAQKSHKCGQWPPGLQGWQSSVGKARGGMDSAIREESTLQSLREGDRLSIAPHMLKLIYDLLHREGN